jgi:hypothetical protein
VSEVPSARDVLDGFQWCRERAARVQWGRDADEPACRVEVLAPSSSFRLLRGEAADFYEAYIIVRAQFEAEEGRTAARERGEPGTERHKHR